MEDDDLASLQRAVLKPDGTAGVLRWVARRFDASAVLLDCAGKPERAFPDFPSQVLLDVAGDIERLTTGECAAVSVCGLSWWARMVRAGGRWNGSTLFVTASKPFTAADSALIARAGALLQLRRTADGHAEATARTREAVLHLLMAGQVTAASQVAGAMKPMLAEKVRVYVAEGTPAARQAVADACQIACHGSAWIVDCPAYRRQTIILSPAAVGWDAGGMAAQGQAALARASSSARAGK